MTKCNNRYDTEENKSNTLKNVFQALNWSKRTLNDGIFSKPGMKFVCGSMARYSKQTTKYSVETASN